MIFRSRRILMLACASVLCMAAPRPTVGQQDGRETTDVSGPLLAQRPLEDRQVVAPILDVPLRDPSICRGPDGTYYLTGTGATVGADGNADFDNCTTIRIWKSPDLRTWTELCVAFDLAKAGWNDRWATGPRALAGQADAPRHNLGVTAPEIHYLKDTFWIAFSVNGQGTGLLRSKSGKAEGPYEPWGRSASGLGYITAIGGDPSLFQDDDGTIYWLWSPAWIAKMKDDLTGLAESPRLLTCQPRVPLSGDVLVGSRGPFLWKTKGKYHLAVADTIPRLGIHTEDTLVATSESLFGPYSKREMMVPHGGQSTVFQDSKGNWYATFCGRDRFAALRDRAAVVPLEWMDRFRYLMWRPNNPVLRANPEKVFTERGPWHKLRPILDKPGMNIRDMNMIQAPDGFFYFTGSVYGEAYKGKLTIFRSRDLKNWEEIVVRTFDDETDVPEARRKYRTDQLGDWNNYYMDCEIHYLPRQKTFFITYNAYAPKNLPDPKANVGFGGVLRSTTGKGEGPYEKIRDGACQSGFFEDEDGTVYEYWGINGLVRLNPDFSKAEKLPTVNRAGGGLWGEDSGCYMVKMLGKYVFFTTGCNVANQHWIPQSAHSYDFHYMVADSPKGPWSEWMPGVRHGGHGGVFRGLDGHWYGVVWGEDILGSFHCKPGVVRLKVELIDGRLMIDVDPDWTPDDYIPPQS